MSDHLRPIADFLDPQPGRPAQASQSSQEADADLDDCGKLDLAAVDPAALADCARLDQSDTDNGIRLRRHFGEDLAVLQAEGARNLDYVTWVGDHWDAASGNDSVQKVAQKVGELIKLEAEMFRPLSDETESAFETRCDRRRSFGVTSKNRARIDAMLACAAPHLTRSPDLFNVDPMLVATQRHTLRFSRDPKPADPYMERLAYIDVDEGHRREDFITKIVPVTYDAGAKCPLWDAFLAEFLPDPNVRDCVHVFSGAGLLGVPIQKVFFHYGLGANGKSVFMETIMRLMGPLGVELPAESVAGGNDRSGAGASPDLARLYGARVVRVSELPADKLVEEALVKKLTGGERIPVRNLFKGFFDFRPVFKAHMSGNGYPRIDGTDNGIWRRIAVIHWPIQIPVERRRESDEVIAEFMTEAPGILNWLIGGALLYLQNGLVIPKSVEAATQDYRDEMDPIGQFIADCIVEAPGESVQARALYNAYTAWSEANAKKPIFENKFGRVMKTRLRKDEDSRLRAYLDIRLENVPPRPVAPRNPDE